MYGVESGTRMSLGGPMECDHVGCTALRRTVNHWYVVTEDMYGAHIYRWAMCPEDAMKNGKHFCGLNHAFIYTSNVLTPDTTDTARESTLELKPMTREGTVPVEVKEEPIQSLEITPVEPEKTEQ